jgi:hypothetical protein
VSAAYFLGRRRRCEVPPGRIQDRAYLAYFYPDRSRSRELGDRQFGTAPVAVDGVGKPRDPGHFDHPSH